ncbi:MAG: phosphohistidine phosphatase [Bacteroidota bacterium]|jgi:phosphohistidine phosphatase
MKTIHIIRHAKSSWADEGMRDFDRPLNDRGERDAPAMAKRLQSRIGKVDLIVASPAKRTTLTSRFFCDAFNYSKENVKFIPTIYEAPLQALIEAVNNLPDSANEVLFIGHNYGVSHLVQYLTDENVDMPTCAIASIQLDIEQWSWVTRLSGRLVEYDYPKKEM